MGRWVGGYVGRWVGANFHRAHTSQIKDFVDCN